MKLVLASNNPGKLAELHAMFASLGLELVRQGDLGVPEAAEPHRTADKSETGQHHCPARRFGHGLQKTANLAAGSERGMNIEISLTAVQTGKKGCERSGRRPPFAVTNGGLYEAGKVMS